MGGAAGRSPTPPRGAPAFSSAKQSWHSRPPLLQTATLWVQHKGPPGTRFAEWENVDLHQTTVSKFIKLWAAEVLPHVHPSLITMGLASLNAQKPSAAEEELVRMFDDPSLSLAEAGVTGRTAWLLAFVADPAPGKCESEPHARSVCALTHSSCRFAFNRKGDFRTAPGGERGRLC